MRTLLTPHTSYPLLVSENGNDPLGCKIDRVFHYSCDALVLRTVEPRSQIPTFAKKIHLKPIVELCTPHMTASFPALGDFAQHENLNGEIVIPCSGGFCPAQSSEELTQTKIYHLANGDVLQSRSALHT